MSDWPPYRLTDLATYHNGLAFKPADWSEDGLPIIRIEQLNNPEGPSDKYLGHVPEVSRIRDGDLVFSWSATLKVVIWKHGDGALNQHLFKVVPKHGFDARFVYFLLDWNIDALSGGSHGSTMKHIKRSELEKFRVHVPPVHVQERISQVLSSIDTAIENTEALIAKYQQIKAGLMHDLFARGVLPNGQLRPPREQAPELYQETAIGWIPREWAMRRLGDLCELSSGGTPSRHQPSYWRGTIPWIKTGEVRYRAIIETEEYITERGLAHSSAKVFPKDTIVMAMYGEGNTRGRVATLGVPCASNQACVGFSFGPSAHNRYMYYFFAHNYDRLRDMSNDGSQKNLSAAVLKEFAVTFPTDLKEQVEIAQRLASLDAYLNAESDRAEKLLTRRLGLMQDLLTGRVPVHVDAPEATHA